MDPRALEQNIETWPLSRIVEYARNPRKNEPAVDRMCASIRDFGFKIPCLVRSNGELVDGHLRLKAARSLGLREIPVMLCDEWSAAQVKAFRLLVNRSATWADFDDELLALELQDIGGADFDLSLTGFDAGEIDELLEKGDLSQAEACALTGVRSQESGVRMPKPAVSQAGDLWLCGPHRVLCGDAASGEAVARLLGERRVRLLVTEVPDGVESDSERRDCVDVIVRRWQMLTGQQATLDGDGRSFEEVARERRMALRAAQGLHHQSTVFHAVYVSDIGVIEQCQDFGFALETRHALGVAGEGLRQDLQRYVAFQPGVASPIYFPHAARA